MPPLIVLRDMELAPVLELEPWKFATHSRTLPTASSRELPDEWLRYWLDCLADSGVVGLEPLRAGSMHVPVRQLAHKPTTLETLLNFFVNEWGGPQVFSDPDQKPVLGGGLALCAGDQVLAEPTCCVDLSNLSDWQEAAGYRETGWTMLWIGHPWLSVRYEAPWLVLSEPHESENPAGHWAVSPDDLDRAVQAAEADLERLALPLRSMLEAMGVEDAVGAAQQLAGLPSRPVTIDSSWLTPTVRGLAEFIRLERAFNGLPVLADALLDAGCDNEEILGHCRSDDLHSTVCWVVDTLLAKE